MHHGHGTNKGQGHVGEKVIVNNTIKSIFHYKNLHIICTSIVTNSKRSELRVLSSSHNHTHPHNRLMALCPVLPGYAGTRRNIHPLTHPDHRISFITSFIYCDPQNPACSIYVLDSPFPQPLSRSPLVFLLVWDPLLHTPYISSPNHHLFATHAHTNAVCSAVIPMPHIYLTILISAHWSAISHNQWTRI